MTTSSTTKTARGFTFSAAPAGLPTSGRLLFASGLSRPGNSAPFIDAGAPIGTVAGELSRSMVATVAEYAGRGGQVFVDSGAFPTFRQNMKRAEQGLPAVALNFEAVFATYEALVEASPEPSNLWLVAPDVIGDQAETFRLLATYRARCATLVARGARLLVPLQKGDLAGAELYAAAVEALDGLEFVVALPFNAKAYTTEEAVAFLHDASPARVHLLGGGLKKLAAVAELAPAGVEIQGDANRLRAWVGQGRVEAAIRAQFLDLEDQAAFRDEDPEAYAELLSDSRHEAIWKLAAWELGTSIGRIPSFLGARPDDTAADTLSNDWAPFLPQAAQERLELEVLLPDYTDALDLEDGETPHNPELEAGTMTHLIQARTEAGELEWTSTLEAFEAANADDPETCSRARDLFSWSPGVAPLESVQVGGGASPAVTLTALEVHELPERQRQGPAPTHLVIAGVRTPVYPALPEPIVGESAHERLRRVETDRRELRELAVRVVALERYLAVRVLGRDARAVLGRMTARENEAAK